ncbi:MAG TPA: universal stress protein, partial [Chitinophagaceae bacterium]
MRTFIVPTDFSENARNAGIYAVQLAKQLEADILLLHVYSEPTSMMTSQVDVMTYDNIREHILRKLRERIKELETIVGEGSVNISGRSVRDRLVEQVSEIYQEKDARLVVIGLTGSNSLEHMFLGSNTIGIVNNSGCTVLTVPPQATFHPIRKVLFACDMKNVADSIPAEKMKKILQVVNAELMVLHVQRGNMSPESLDQELVTLRQMLEGVNFSFHSLKQKNIIAGIKDFAKENEADMILIIPRKHDFLEGLLRMNHTKAMLFRSSIPILTITPE